MTRRPPFRTTTLGLSLLLAIAACAPAGDERRGAPLEILWDTWGVPHVFADEPVDLFYGFGRAQATNHADLVLRLLGEARGRAAEYWGEEHLALDRWTWTMGIPGRAAEWLAAQDPEMRSFLDAFAEGFNDYAAENPDAVDDDVEVVLPISARDLMAHTQRIIHFTFIVDRREIAGAERRFADGGSNAWAISPARSASGNAILVSNPHLPWSGLFTWFETHLVTRGVDVYGAALVGSPFLGIGFNRRLGWTHTVNTHDGDDLFELTLAGDGYLFDGEVRAFDREEIELGVRREDGSLRSESLTVKRSVHGPVVAESDGRALALAVVGLGAAEIPRQYWDMSRARDLEEFEAALRRMQMPMFTTLYADREGNILHHFGGETPVRPRGDWATWSEPVPGDSSEWTWSGVHGFDELPTVLNPASGWLQNANDPPWTTTFPRALEPADFPAYMAPRFMHFRAQRSARMLAEDESITFEEAADYKMSTRMELAERILDDLGEAVAAHGDADAERAMEVLEAWDLAADAGSRGAVLFSRFWIEMEDAGQSLATPRPATGFAIPWSRAEPRTTPDGLADPAAAARALAAAARAVEERHGSLDVAWGEVYRLRRGDHDHPGNGGPGAFGIFRVVGYATDEDGLRVAGGGDSFVSVVEFGDPPRASVLLAYGNASQPGSPHVGDQLELFSQKRLRDVWLSRGEIEANLARRESPVRGDR